MLHFLSHKSNLKNEARLYHVNFIKNALCSFSFIVVGIVLMVVLSSALNPQPNSAEGWILFALLAVISLALVVIVAFNAGILSSSYCVFAVYRNDTITITPLSEVALINVSRIKTSFNGSLKAARQASQVMQNFTERYDFEDFFLDNSFLSTYSHNLVKILSIRKMGKYTVVLCKTQKYNPALKKQELKNAHSISTRLSLKTLTSLSPFLKAGSETDCKLSVKARQTLTLYASLYKFNLHIHFWRNYNDKRRFKKHRNHRSR